MSNAEMQNHTTAQADHARAKTEIVDATIALPKVKRVDSLTAEQRARFPEWVDKWTKIGLSTEPADRPRAEKAIRAYYRAAKLPEPKRIAWTTSPFAGAFAFPAAALIIEAEKRHKNASVGDSVGASVDASVRASVDASVRDSVGDSVGDSVRDSVDDSVDDSVGASVDASVRASVRASVGDSVGASVDDSVRDSVRASVDASVRDSVGVSVGDSVDASVRDSVGVSVDASVDASDPRVLKAYRDVLQSTYYRYLGGQFWVGWGWGWWSSPSMLSFLRDVCSLDFGDKTEIVDAIIALGESCCWWWPHRDFALACERPATLHRDDRGRLHNESGPAISFRDGWSLYRVHGVRVPAEIIEHPETLTAQRIDAEENAEVRRVMIEKYKLSRYVRDAEFKVLHEDTDPLGFQRRLLRKELAGDEPLVLVELTNSSTEPDGSRKIYHLRVDPELRPLLENNTKGKPQKPTCQNAVASTFGLTGKQYALECET